MQGDRLMEQGEKGTDRAGEQHGRTPESRKHRGLMPSPILRQFAESDEELYRQMRTGNQRAFATLYERREPALYRYALHMTGSRTAAEEVAQEVFVRLLGPHLLFDDRRGSLEGYMYGVARNLVRVMRRKGSVEEVVEQSAEHDILGDLIKDQATAALYRVLSELPEHYRDAVVLCDLEERSYEDASRLMECPVGTVRSRLHRARSLLASRLKPEQAAPEARVR
jgi:RNA polymerase sigma-70 factor (ECF subfamily)